jgi:hypothetical protein
MQQTPITDKSIGIGHTQWGLGDDKFSSVRHKAMVERQELKHRSKKDKAVKVPEYGPGERVVVCVGWKERAYQLIEVVDFTDYRGWRSGPFEYFGILLKTTNKADLPRIGRLCTFGGYRGRIDISPAKVEEEDVVWLDQQ